MAVQDPFTRRFGDQVAAGLLHPEKDYYATDGSGKVETLFL